MPRLVRAEELVKAGPMTIQSLYKLIACGAVRPAVLGQQGVRSPEFTILQAIGIVLARNLIPRGITGASAANLIGWFSMMSNDEFAAYRAKGCTHLVIVGGVAKLGLFSPDTVITLAQSASVQRGVLVYGVDVALIHMRLLALMDQSDAADAVSAKEGAA